MPKQCHISSGVGQVVFATNPALSLGILETHLGYVGELHPSVEPPELVQKQMESGERTAIVATGTKSRTSDMLVWKDGERIYYKGQRQEACGLHRRRRCTLIMLAVFGALFYLREMWIGGDMIQARSDNMTVVNFINKQGKTKSPTLCFLTKDLLNWCRDRHVKLLAVYVQGERNVLADLNSRKGLPQE